MRSSSGRSQLALAALGVALVIVLAEFGARLVMSQTTEAIRWYDAVAQRKVEQMDSRGSVDVVFAGTSMAQQAFVPSVIAGATEQTAWNAGLAGGTPEVMSPWLLEEVVPRLRPTTVVWGLSSFDLAPAYGPAQAEVYDNALATRDGWLADVERAVATRSVLVRNRPVLRSLDALAGDAADDRGEAHDEAARLTGPDGERTDDTVDRSDQRRRIVQARLAGFEPNPDDIDLIARTAGELRRQGIDVVLVELPVPDRFREAHPRGDADHALVGPALASIAEELDLRFLRLTDASTSEEFIDFTHLRPDAAADFSLRVANALSSGRDDTTATMTAAPSPDSPATVPAADPLAGATCEPEIVRDEYGFEIDLANCDRDSSAVTADDLLRSIPEPSVQDAAVDLLDRLRLVADPACEQPESWREATTAATDATVDFAAALRASESAWVGTGDARSFADVIRQLLVGQVGCSNGFSLVDAESVERTAARAAAANDAVFSALSGTTTQNIVSEFWYHRWELGHTRQLAALSDAATDIDILFVGASVGKHGIDPHAVGEAFSASVYNASVPGQSSEMLGLWWATVDELGIDPALVVVARSPFEGFLPCTTERLDAAIRARQLRREAFGSIPALQHADEHRLMSEAAVEMVERFGLQVDERGWFSSRRSRDENGKARQVDNLTQVFAEWDGCVDRDARVADVFADLDRALGERVLVVDFPLHPELTALHPQGRSVFDRHQAMFTDSLPDDVAYLDLRDLLPPDEFLDLTHANLDGQARITGALIDFIADESAFRRR